MVEKLIGVLALIFMITALAMVVGRKSQTASVLRAFLGGLNNLQKTAVSPVL